MDVAVAFASFAALVASWLVLPADRAPSREPVRTLRGERNAA